MRVDDRNNSKLMWVIAGGLIAIILLAIAFFWLSSARDTPAKVEQNNPTEVKPKIAETAPVVKETQTEQAASSEANVQTLVDEQILKNDIPKNASLAKEEVAKLEDVQKQLNDQEHNLKAQHSDADQLIKLKEEQIKLLEEQLKAEGKS